RNNSVHFYNAKNFGAVLYALAQTSIVNFRDLLEQIFGASLADEIDWSLLPLALKPPINPIEYISGKPAKGRGSAAVRQHSAQRFADTLRKLPYGKTIRNRNRCVCGWKF